MREAACSWCTSSRASVRDRGSSDAHATSAATTFQTTCPFKGAASYWSAVVDGESHDGIVWAYEEPIESAAAIAGYLSFYPHRVEVVVNGERLPA